MVSVTVCHHCSCGYFVRNSSEFLGEHQMQEVEDEAPTLPWFLFKFVFLISACQVKIKQDIFRHLLMGEQTLHFFTICFSFQNSITEVHKNKSVSLKTQGKISHTCNIRWSNKKYTLTC